MAKFFRDLAVKLLQGILVAGMPAVIGYFSAYPWYITYLLVIAAIALGWFLTEKVKLVLKYDIGAEAKVRQWVDRTAYPIKKELKPASVLPNATFMYHITSPAVATDISVCQCTGNDSLFLMANIHIGKDLVKRFHALPEKQRLLTLDEAKIELLKMGVGFDIKATLGLLHPPFIQTTCAYTADMGYGEFFAAFDRFGRAIAIFKTILVAATRTDTDNLQS